jgi:hypothetical protein
LAIKTIISKRQYWLWLIMVTAMAR